MTSLAKLFTQKQQLLGRLEENPGPNERAQLERLMEKVDAALSSLDPAPTDIAEDRGGRSDPAAINNATSPSATSRAGRR